jgi:hypothetical protein
MVLNNIKALEILYSIGFIAIRLKITKKNSKNFKKF